jgi:predicted ATPase
MMKMKRATDGAAAENCSPTTTTTTTEAITFSSHSKASEEAAAVGVQPQQQQQQQKQKPSICGVSFLEDDTNDKEDENWLHESYRNRKETHGIENGTGTVNHVQQQQEQEPNYRLDFSTLKAKGRDEDVQRLHEIYRRVTSSSSFSSSSSLSWRPETTAATPSASTTAVAMIQGMSGTGKSTLVKKFLQEVVGGVAQRGATTTTTTAAAAAEVSPKPYIFSGKCDELSGGDPFSAIVEAVSGFATMLLLQQDNDNDDDDELKRIQKAVHASLGTSELQALLTMIPTLRHVLISTTNTNTKKKKKKYNHNHNTHTKKAIPVDANKDAMMMVVEESDHHPPEQSQSPPTPSPSRPITLRSSSGYYSKENAWNRLKYSFQLFTRAISTREHPVILFLDDLQWCDAASLELLEALWTDQELNCFMLVGTYRTEEVLLHHHHHPEKEEEDPLLRKLETLEQQQRLQQRGSDDSLIVERIELVNLTLPELHSFIADALHTNREDNQRLVGDNINNKNNSSNNNNNKTKTLTEMIYRKTLGNILFAVQALEELQRKGILYFSRQTREWECKFMDGNGGAAHHGEGIQSLEDLLSDNVLAAITSKIASTPALLQQALILAAYTRSTVDIDTLYQLLLLKLLGGGGGEEEDGGDGSPHTPTTTTITCPDLVKLLDEAVVDGLLYNTMGSKSYSFAHDRIQQAAYAMVPSGPERDAFRLTIGLRLYEMGHQTSSSSAPFSSASSFSCLSLDGRTNDWMLFVAADHLNATSDQVRNTLGEMFLIQLNLELGERAAAVAAYEIASKHLRLALECSLQGGATMKDPWDTEYKTTLQIYQCLVDVELCQGHFDVGSSMGESLLQHARTVEDKLPTHIALVKALRRELKHKSSFELCVQSLRGLKEYPQGWFGVHAGLVKDYLYIKRYFKKNFNDAILELPRIREERLIQTMELLGLAAYQAYLCDRKSEFLATTLRMLRFTFQHGLCGHSGVAVMGWALFLDSIKDMDGVTRCSHLALDILRITKAKEQECLQLFVVANWISAWKDPYEHVLEIFSRAYRSGMESGDFENGLLSQCVSYQYEFLAGYSLVQLDTKSSSLIDKLDLYKVHSVKVIALQQWLVVQHLRGSAHAPPLNFAELEAFGFEAHDGSEKYRVLHGCLSRMQLGVYFGNCQFSEVFIHKVSPLVGLDCSNFTNSVRLFFGSLTFANLAREKKKQKRSYRNKSKKYAQELKALCKLKGMNSWHRYLLAEAHCFAGSAKSGDSIQTKYDYAIAAALNSGHGQDAALGCQLVAEYFLAMQDGILFHDLARAREWTVQQYLTQARDWYLQWGAKGLVHHLETKYSRYLMPTQSSVVIDDDDQSMDVVSCANSIDLGDTTEYFPSLPKMVVHRPEDDVSVISEQSAWRKAPPLCSYLHTEADGRLPAVLELE